MKNVGYYKTLKAFIEFKKLFYKNIDNHESFYGEIGCDINFSDYTEYYLKGQDLIHCKYQPAFEKKRHCVHVFSDNVYNQMSLILTLTAEETDTIPEEILEDETMLRLWGYGITSKESMIHSA